MANFAAASGAVNAMGQIFGMIAQAQDAESEAADQWRKAQGVAMGIMYGIKAGAEVAEAVASFASQNYPAGALHVISAGLFTAQSVAAFSQLAQSGGGAATTTGAAAAPTFRPAEPEKVARSADDGGRTIIIEKNYYLSEGLAELGAVVESSSYEMGRQRVRADVPNNEYR